MLVKIKLNEMGFNTGSIDRDTGTDGILFGASFVKTYQVKTGLNRWNRSSSRKVDIEFFVKIVKGSAILLDESVIEYRIKGCEGAIETISKFTQDFHPHA